MDTKERLQRQATLRQFIGNIVGESDAPTEVLDVSKSDLRLAQVLTRHYQYEWQSYSDVATAIRELKRWISAVDCELICWVPDAGAFRNPSIRFLARVENLLVASNENLLLSTTDDEHGVAFLRGEHDIGLKSW